MLPQSIELYGVLVKHNRHKAPGHRQNMKKKNRAVVRKGQAQRIQICHQGIKYLK